MNYNGVNQSMSLPRHDSITRHVPQSQFESGGIEDIHTIFVFQYI